MPITLHDFNKIFVVKSNGLPGFGSPCSPLGWIGGNQGNCLAASVNSAFSVLSVRNGLIRLRALQMIFLPLTFKTQLL